MNKLNCSIILKISMFTNATNKFWSLVMNGLADVDGFKICIQVCVWPRFPPFLKIQQSLRDFTVDACCLMLLQVVAVTNKQGWRIWCCCSLLQSTLTAGNVFVQVLSSTMKSRWKPPARNQFFIGTVKFSFKWCSQLKCLYVLSKRFCGSLTFTGGRGQRGRLHVK